MKRKGLLIGLIVVLLEIFIFNFSSIKSMFYSEIKLDINNIELEGLKKSTSGDSYYVTKDDNYVILNINKKINNIYLDISTLKRNNLFASFEYTDDANNNFVKSYSEIYNHEIVKNFEKSKYIDCYYLGKTHSIKLDIDVEKGEYLNIDNIILNKRVPFFINYYRMILLFIIIFIPYYYKKNNNFKDFFDKNYKCILYVAIVSFSLLVVFLYKNMSQYSITYDHYTTEYKDALMSGKFDFDIKGVDVEEFKNKENIYDYTQRVDLTYKAFDTSYYNGKFYMYFGFLPALIMGITNLSLVNISCIFNVLGVVFSALFLDLLIDRYNLKVNKGVKLLLVIYFLFNSRLLLLISYTRFYELLVISGYSLCVIGLYLFMKFYNSNKKIYLIFGSLLLSLSLMCRPSMLIVSLFGLYLIYKKLNKNNILYYFIPYIMIGLILMYTNYIRFGSIFDFGINYQIGIIDNSYLKFNLMTVINSILVYLFRVPVIGNSFPYIYNSVLKLPYNGFYYNTSIGNGIIIMSILGIILPFIRKKVNKETKYLILISFVCGIILLLINSTAGGFIKRYTLEFAWLFLIPIIIYSINVFKNNKMVIYILVIISCLINFLVIFDTEKDDIQKKMNNNLYYYLKYF